jgi:hypothetical protein
MSCESGIRYGHSAEVELSLFVGLERLQIAKLGPDYLVLAEPKEIDPCTAMITLLIDGRPQRWEVFLKDGVVPFEPVVRFSALDRNADRV